MATEAWKVVITITGPEIDIETANIAWADIPRALVEAYRSITPSVIKEEMTDETAKRLHQEIVKAMEEVIGRFEGHTFSA